MSYELFQQGTEVYIPIFLLSLAITIIAYGAFPFILAITRKTPITTKKYRNLCFAINIVIMALFISSQENASSSGPYVLWTMIFYNWGKRKLDKKGLLSDGINFPSLDIETLPNTTHPLGLQDVEYAVSAYLKKQVSIADICCTLVYVIPASTGEPQEMHLAMTVDTKEFSSLDLMFFDKKRQTYCMHGKRLALDLPWMPVEEIFSFDVSLFKSFEITEDTDESTCTEDEIAQKITRITELRDKGHISEELYQQAISNPKVLDKF